MSRGKNEVKDFFVAVSVAFTILQVFDSSFEIPAFILGSLSILWLIYDKIPGLLNRRFSDEDKAFAKDFWLRCGLVFFSFAMFASFALNLYLGRFLLPRSLLGIASLELDLSIFGIIVLVFVSIYYFSWRLWKYEDLAEQLWKMTSWTETEFEKEKATAERSKLYSLISKYLGPGVVPMAVCVLLFMGWLVLFITDFFMIGLLLLWLFRDLLGYHTSSKHGWKNVLHRWDGLMEDLVWKVFARAGIASLDSVLDAIMIILGFMIIVLSAMIGWSTFIGVMVFFDGWYILFVLFQIGLRSSARVRIKEGVQSLDESSFVSLPQSTDLILFSSYLMISTFSLSAFFQISEFFTISYMFVSIALNVWALVTIILWLKQPEKRCRFSNKKQEEKLKLKNDLLRDRYRLYATIFFLGLPIVAAAGVFSALVLWIGVVSGLILACFDADFRKKIQREKAGVYASLLTAYMGTSVFMILGAAMYGLPELKTFLIPVGGFFTILLVVYWLAIFRIKRRWKWK